jgi:lipopolysaccharide export system protein LptA
LTGHVSLTQGADVTTGDKLVYDLNTGVANVFSAPGSPVKSLFVQGSQPGEAKPGGLPKASPGKPAAASPSSKPPARPSTATASSAKGTSAKTGASSSVKAAEP